MDWGYYFMWFLVGVFAALTVVRIKRGASPNADFLSSLHRKLLGESGDEDHGAPWVRTHAVLEEDEPRFGGLEFTGMGTRLP